MKREELLFEFTPPIRRYVEKIIYFADEFLAQSLENTITIQGYEFPEDPTPRNEESNNNFWEYLTKTKAIELTEEPEYKSIVRPDINGGLFIVEKTEFKITNIEPIKEIRLMIKNEETCQKNNTKIGPSRVEFDGLNHILRYKASIHKFHNNADSEQPTKLKLFQKLWEVKKETRKGKIKAEGELLPASALAVQIGLIDYARDYEKRETKNKLYELIKDLRKTFKRKGFPIKIQRENGYLMIVKD
jgi:hypothetical protein